MGKPSIAVALLVILSIDLFLVLGQTSINEIHSGNTLFAVNQSMTASFSNKTGNISTQTAKDFLPEQGLVGETSSSPLYVDYFNVWTSWVSLPLKGANYLFSLLAGPGVYLNAIGAPIAFTLLVGGFWFGITVFLIIAFFMGRE